MVGPALGLIYHKKIGSDLNYRGYSDSLAASN